MYYFITISTIILLVPLNFMIIYSLTHQLRNTYSDFKVKSVIYTIILAMVAILVSYLIAAILTGNNFLTDTEVII